jgi:hypothetical protein
MPRHRLVPLTPDLPEDPGFPVQTCNHCAGELDPKRRETKSVVALEYEGKIHRYYGLCGNHAEVMPYTFEWQEVKPPRRKR